MTSAGTRPGLCRSLRGTKEAAQPAGVWEVDSFFFKDYAPCEDFICSIHFYHQIDRSKDHEWTHFILIVEAFTFLWLFVPKFNYKSALPAQAPAWKQNNQGLWLKPKDLLKHQTFIPIISWNAKKAAILKWHLKFQKKKIFCVHCPLKISYDLGADFLL